MMAGNGEDDGRRGISMMKRGQGGRETKKEDKGHVMTHTGEQGAQLRERSEVEEVARFGDEGRVGSSGLLNRRGRKHDREHRRVNPIEVEAWTEEHRQR